MGWDAPPLAQATNCCCTTFLVARQTVVGAGVGVSCWFYFIFAATLGEPAIAIDGCQIIHTHCRAIGSGATGWRSLGVRPFAPSRPDTGGPETIGSRFWQSILVSFAIYPNTSPFGCMWHVGWGELG